MTDRFSNEINQGLCIKQALHQKIENITIALIRSLEHYLQSVDNFYSFKESISKKDLLVPLSDHFYDGGWSGTSKATFILNDGWSLELTFGRHVYLKNDKLGFLAGSGEHQGGGVFNPPSIFKYQNTVTKLYELDHTLDQLLLMIYDRFVPLRTWFDDLKTRM